MTNDFVFIVDEIKVPTKRKTQIDNLCLKKWLNPFKIVDISWYYLTGSTMGSDVSIKGNHIEHPNPQIFLSRVNDLG